MKISENVFQASNKVKIYELVHNDGSIGLGISTKWVYDSLELDKEGRNLSYDEFINICIEKKQIDTDFGVKKPNDDQNDYIVYDWVINFICSNFFSYKKAEIREYVYKATEEYKENKLRKKLEKAIKIKKYHIGSKNLFLVNAKDIYNYLLKDKTFFDYRRIPNPLLNISYNDWIKKIFNRYDSWKKKCYQSI